MGKILQTKLSLNEADKISNVGLFVAAADFLPNYPFLKAKLFEYFNYDIQNFFNVTTSDLNNFKETYPNVSIPREFFKNLEKIDPKISYEKFLNSNTKLLTFDDPLYPEILKQIEDFPLSLFYKGNFEGIDFEKTIAIVGSRNATENAKINVQNIVSDFKNTNVTFVSGLAAGIDAACHKATLDNGLKTIAVIGSGLDFEYPAVNKYLYRKILEDENGAIISEFPYAFPPSPQNFPQRNRIVTGLSKGVIIAEAKIKSGAMISAKLALEQGRELMCIPGLISNPNCEGIYRLIKQGAGIVTNFSDILSCLGWEISVESSLQIELDELEQKIYHQIACEEISVEGLNIKLDIGINELMMKLTEMELNGLIVQKNGIYYVLRK